jgi:hypothetical protein
VLIKLRTLNKLFDDHMNGIPVFCTGTCCDCGRAFAIQIDRVAGGYGFQGGALHEVGNWQFMVRCETCHQISLKPDRVSKSAKTSADVSVSDVRFFSKLSTPEAG